jgi:hypothetical protein
MFMGSFPEPDSRYDALLMTTQVSRERWGEFKKWIRFYLHFCEKYRHNPADAKSLPLFNEKLSSKNQTTERQASARQAVELHRGLLSPGDWITEGYKETAPTSVALQQPSSCQDHEAVYRDGRSTSGIRRKEHAKAANSNFKSYPDFNLDTVILSVQFGKGEKSRMIPLPKRIFPEIMQQFEFVKNLYQEDLRKGYTTMIYTHTIISDTKPLKSPLDL